MDPSACLALAESLGLNPGDILSIQSATARRKAPLMAASAPLWGLNLWISGSEYILLDTKGFVAVTFDSEVALALCTLESRLGPGATRCLLQVPVIDPMAAITALDPRFTTRVKPVEDRHKINPKAPREKPKGVKPSLAPEVLASLLADL